MIRNPGKTERMLRTPQFVFRRYGFFCSSPGIRWAIGLTMVLGLAGHSLSASAASSANLNPPPLKPEARIPVEPLGYLPPGPLYLLSRMSFSSLDFADSSHLLFTFHETRLLRRVEDPDSSEDDQMIHAVVLSVPQGQVSAAADWLMRDRGRYLWPLSNGRFLVRRRNSFSITDESLELRGLARTPTPLRATEVSPDGRLLVVEDDYERHTPEQHEKLAGESARLGEPPPREDTEIALMDVETKTVETAFRVEQPIVLPVTSSGYLAVREEKENDYLIRFVPFHGQQVTLGTVASTCTPSETFLNAKALMIESCGPDSDDAYLDAWTIDGKKLWRGRRDGHAVWPTLARAQNGSRFAVGLLQATHPINLADSLDDEDVKQQLVQVFDTETGKLLLSTNASPILSAGQNFALSPTETASRCCATVRLRFTISPRIHPLPPPGNSRGRAGIRCVGTRLVTPESGANACRQRL